MIGLQKQVPQNDMDDVAVCKVRNLRLQYLYQLKRMKAESITGPLTANYR